MTSLKKKSQIDLLNKIFDNSSQIDCAGAILLFVCEKLKVYGGVKVSY